MAVALKATDFLTLEEILAMPAGPQLDRMAVFLAPFLRRDQVREVLAGRPSENIAAAWALLESEMGEAGGYFSSHVDGWQCQIGDGPEVIAETAPLAICRAIVAEAIPLTDCNSEEEGAEDFRRSVRRLLRLKKIAGKA